MNRPPFRHPFRLRTGAVWPIAGLIACAVLASTSCQPPELASSRGEKEAAPGETGSAGSASTETAGAPATGPFAPVDPDANAVKRCKSAAALGGGDGESLPQGRELINKAGATVYGAILAKRGNEIAFQRSADGRTFVLSLDRLKLGDGLALAQLEDHEPGLIGQLQSGTLAQTRPGSQRGGGQAGGASERSGASWHEDRDAAFAEAEKHDLPIYMLFTGSDWCPPCQALEHRVLSGSTFQDYADENLVLLKLDFPRRRAQRAELKRQNQALAKEWNVSGFPTVIVATPDGETLRRSSGFGGESPGGYVARIDEAL